MDVFASAKGCVYVPSSQSGGGFYGLEGLDAGAASNPTLILGAEIQDTDIVLPVSTLNNVKILYTFGKSFGDVRVLGNVLLGPSGGGANLKRVVSWFQSRRVSDGGGSPVNMSYPGGAYKIYVTGFGLSQPHPEFHIQPFMVYGMVASPKS